MGAAITTKLTGVRGLRRFLIAFGTTDEVFSVSMLKGRGLTGPYMDDHDVTVLHFRQFAVDGELVIVLAERTRHIVGVVRLLPALSEYRHMSSSVYKPGF